MNKKNEIWLNLGSGVSLSDDFINVDNYFSLEDLKRGQETKKGVYQNARVTKNSKFIRADILKLPFKDNYADYIECNDVIEHQPMKDVKKAFKEMYRVLKPGCKLCLSTTNFDELARLWTMNITGNLFKNQVEWDKYLKLSEVIYGNQAGKGEFHKSAFNPLIISYHLQSVGFDLKDIVITIFPTNSPFITPQKAYSHIDIDWENKVILTEMMWVECIKR